MYLIIYFFSNLVFESCRVIQETLKGTRLIYGIKPFSKLPTIHLSCEREEPK